MKRSLSIIVAVLTVLLAVCLSGCGPDFAALLPPEVTETPQPTVDPNAVPSPTPYEGVIESLEINQALSFGYDVSSGEYYEMDSFVSKRDTAVFARMSKFVDVDYTGETQYMEVLRDGELVAVITPAENSFGPDLCFAIMGDAAWLLTEGEYSFRVFIDGAEAETTATLRDTVTLDVLLLPVLGNYNGSIQVPADSWETDMGLVSACFPLSADGLNITTAEQLDLSGEEYDLTNADGLFEAWASLWQQRGDYDIVIGFTSGLMGVTRSLDSYSCGDGVWLISTDMTIPQAVVAHEIAQYFGVGDEYEGGLLNQDVNPAPYGVSGTDIDDRSAAVKSTMNKVEDFSKYGLYGSGSVVYEEQIAFGVGTLTQHGYAASFMGDVDEYVSDYWITSAIWEYLYGVFTDTSTETEPLGVVGLLITGSLSDDGRFTPYSYEQGEAPVYAVSGEGEYTFEVTDEGGEVLCEYTFSPTFDIDTNPPSTAGKFLVNIALGCPAGWKDITLTGPVTTVAEDGTETTEVKTVWTTVEPEEKDS